MTLPISVAYMVKLNLRIYQIKLLIYEYVNVHNFSDYKNGYTYFHEDWYEDDMTN